MINLINEYKKRLEPIKGLLRDPIKGTDIDNKAINLGVRTAKFVAPIAMSAAKQLPSVARGVAKETIWPAAQAVGNLPAFYAKTLPYAKNEAQKNADMYLNQQKAAQMSQQMGNYGQAKTLMDNSLKNKRLTESYYNLLDPVKKTMARESLAGGGKSLLMASGVGAGAKAITGASAIGGALGGTFAKIGGQDVAEGIGQGIGAGFTTAGLGKLTNPIIDPIVEYAGLGKSLLPRILSRATAQGTLNMLEDNSYNLLTKGKMQNIDENTFSFALGAIISPLNKYNPNQKSVVKLVNDKLVFDGKQWRNLIGQYAKQNNVPIATARKGVKAVEQWITEMVDVPVKRGEQIVGYTKIPRIKAILQDQGGGVGLDQPGYFKNQAGASVLRPGELEIGKQWKSEDMVARERFDISKLKKLSGGGSDRDVYDLGDGRVLKIAKSARGLAQNMSEGELYAPVPKEIERGKNYVVVEKANPPDARTKQLVKELKEAVDFNSRMPAVDAINKVAEKYFKSGKPGDEEIGSLIQDFNNYDVMVNDLTSIRNWGTDADGMPIHLDAGTLNTRVIDDYKGKKNLDDPEFRDVYQQSKNAKKKFGDTDPNTMYGLAGSMAGIEPYQDENGEWKVRYDPKKAALGIGASIGGQKVSKFSDSTKLSSLRKQVTQELSQNQASAQVAKQARETLGDDLITKVNQLKKVAKSNAFASGDIETLRSSKYGKLTNEVVESIQEARPDLDEAGALDFALSLPTKNDTRVRKPAELKTLRELESRQKIEQQLWEQDFGRNLKENEFRKMEREWLQSYKTEAPTTAKVKGKQEITAVRQNEKALERLTNEWQQKANPGRIKPYNRGDLNTQQPFGVMKNFATAKDKYAFSYARETAVRNIEETFGKDAPKVKAFVTDKITENETNAVKFRDSIASQLKSVVKKNRIGKSSKDDALVFRYAEGRITEAELARETKNVKGVIATANEFRATYDRLLDGINASLAKYGYDPIPKRKDYMTHFQEVGNFFENFGAIFQDKTMRDNLGDKLPTGMSGINMDTKPGKEFFRNALPRTGDKFTESAIGAMERYLEPASRQIYHTDSVQRVRALQSMVEQHAGKSGKNLSNFNSWLSEYGNILAGKKAVFDRPAEKIFGRGTLKFMNAVRRRTGANMVGGNLSSALTNFIPLSQSIATTSKPAVMKGLLSSISTDARKIDGVESAFLTRRFQDASIAKNWTEKASDMASWAFKAVDHFSSRMIVGGKYYEGISKGMDPASAMKQADDYAARIMADRSFGASPTLFNSQVLGALTQFQLEVNNQLSFIMKDIPKNLGYSKPQIASSLGQLVLYSYLFNGLYEKMTGRRPAFDPLGIAIQAGQDYSNDDMKKGQATKNLTDNIKQQIPIIGGLVGGGRLPIDAALPDPFALANGETTLTKEALKPLTYLAPPFGGGQIKKSIEGVQAYRQGASKTASGRVRYGIPQTAANAVRTAIGGQYSTPEAREYFRSGKAPMGENESKLVLSQDKPSDAISYIQQAKAGVKSKQGGTVTGMGNPAYFDEETGETKVINVSGVAAMPESTNYEKALKQKEAFSKIGPIMDNLDGQMRDDALKAIGISAQDASYYNVARQDNDIKYAYLTDYLAKETDRQKMLASLAFGRKKVNKSVLVADGVLDMLYDDGIISYAERKQLKAIKFDDNGKPATKKSGSKKLKITAPKIKKVKLTSSISGSTERIKKVKSRRAKQYSLTKVKKLTA